MLSSSHCGIRQRWTAIASTLAVLALAATASGSASPPTESLDLSRHRGHVVIVDFWASWCKPCRQSIPWLNSLRARYGASGLTIIGVNVDAERGDADKFLHDVPIDFEVVYDPQGIIAKQFKLQGMPTSFFIDRAGNLAETHLGFREAKKAEIEASIKALLDAPVH